MASWPSCDRQREPKVKPPPKMTRCKRTTVSGAMRLRQPTTLTRRACAAALLSAARATARGGPRAAVTAGVLALLLGCQQPQRRTGAPASEQREIGRSVEGRPMEVLTLGAGAETVLFVATIHGSESAGTPLVYRLLDELRARPELLSGRRVVVLPVANPDGMAQRTRGNARGVDLNRNFPAANYTARARHGAGPLSEPESRALHELLHAVRPTRVVSLHEPLACVDYDGPGAELAAAIAAQAGLPVRRLGSRAGSLGSYVGEELGIPIITLELPRRAGRQTPEKLWARYGAALLTAVSYPDPVADMD